MELKPCPFCQKPAELGGFHGQWYCRCTDADCWAGNHASHWVDDEDAIAAWSTRAAPHTHADLIKVAEAMREMCVDSLRGKGLGLSAINLQFADPREAIRKAGLAPAMRDEREG